MDFNNLVAIQRIRAGVQKRNALRDVSQNDLFAKSKSLPEDVAKRYRMEAAKAGPTLQDWFAEDGFRAIQFMKSQAKIKK